MVLFKPTFELISAFGGAETAVICGAHVLVLHVVTDVRSGPPPSTSELADGYDPTIELSCLFSVPIIHRRWKTRSADALTSLRCKASDGHDHGV